MQVVKKYFLGFPVVEFRDYFTPVRARVCTLCYVRAKGVELSFITTQERKWGEITQPNKKPQPSNKTNPALLSPYLSSTLPKGAPDLL